MTITMNALKMRLHPAMWPNSLDPVSPGIAGLHQSFGAARQFLEELEAVQVANGSNRNLSAAGARDATQRWVNEKLPSLQAKLERVRDDAERFSADRQKRIRDWLGPAPSEPADIALLGEVRTWIRSLPEQSRASKILSLSEKGDRTALRAVLNAPSYLTGVEQGTAESLCGELYRRSEPERDEKDKAISKALEVVERAITGVMSFAQPETSSRQAA